MKGIQLHHQETTMVDGKARAAQTFPVSLVETFVHTRQMSSPWKPKLGTSLVRQKE